MRFTEGGVDLPDELLLAQDDGRVVFFCGAGVSMARAELPNFTGLTERVLNDLGATHDDKARTMHEDAQKFGSDYGIAISDQIFQRMQRSFNVESINEAVSRCLKPQDDVDVSAHKTLLNLSKLQTGETRIITTNFDRLFEQCNRRLKSVSRSNLPNLAYGDANWGVVHLHGCVNADYTGPTRDGFVLSSAEFGDAYLAMGWARSFVKEVLNRYVAVFVGYSADDPPVRYLLEGLSQSDGPTHNAYAFQNEQDGGAIASWDEKGVQALAYSTEKGCGHRNLWKTLDEWGKRTKDPIRWRKRALTMARRGPRNLQSHERGIVAHIVSSTHGAKAFSDYTPKIPAEWLCVFDPAIRYGEPDSLDRYSEKESIVDPFDYYCLDSDQPPRAENTETNLGGRRPQDSWSAFEALPCDLRELERYQIPSLNGHFASKIPYLPNRIGYLAKWISRVADQPSACWWAGKQTALHHEVLDSLQLNKGRNSRKKSLNIIRRAWQTIIEAHNQNYHDDDKAYKLRLKVDRAGWHKSLAQEYANYFSPSIKLNSYPTQPIPPNKGPNLKTRDLISVEIVYSEGIRTVEVPDEYLHPLIRKLTGCLELAAELQLRYMGYLDICSIEPDEPAVQGQVEFGREYKLSGHVLIFVKLFRRLANSEAPVALTELKTWPTNNEVFDRLRIWALGNLDISPIEVFVDEILKLPKAGVWQHRARRDLLLGIARRWLEMDTDSRKKVEKQLLQMPPKPADQTKDDYNEISAHLLLSRIHWLKSNGCEPSSITKRKIESLHKLAPDWEHEYAAGAASAHGGKSGSIRLDTDTSVIENLPPEDIIPYIQNMQTRLYDKFVELAPFQGLSLHNPEKALLALKSRSKNVDDISSFWQTFLRTDNRKDDSFVFTCDIADILGLLSTDQFQYITLDSSRWFLKIGSQLLAESPERFNSLWIKFVSSLSTDLPKDRSAVVRGSNPPDWASEAINSPAGNLADFATNCPPGKKLEAGEQFPKDWLDRLHQLLKLPGDSRRYVLFMTGYKLNWLFQIDPEWTITRILSLLNMSDSMSSDEDAIWAGYFKNAYLPQFELFNILKPHLKELARSRTQQRTRFLESLAAVLLGAWGQSGNAGNIYLSNSEMRELILIGDTEFRQHILWILYRWSQSEPFQSKIIEFLEFVWPKQKQVRTTRASAILCDIAFSQKENYPTVAKKVSTLVTKVGNEQLHIPVLRNLDETVAGEHPEVTLALLHAVLPNQRSKWPYGANDALKYLVSKKPDLRTDPRYLELESKL